MPAGTGVTVMQKPSRKIMEEAAEWLTLMQDTPLSASEQTAFNRWRALSPQHAQAWLTAQDLMGMIDAVPAEIGKTIWGRKRLDRRSALKALTSLLFIAPCAKLLWDEWPSLSADYKTSVGETQKVTLADGSRVHLNTASSINIHFSATERLVHLVEGEVLIETGKAGAGQKLPPFVVQTKSGRIRALGTRFSVRQFEDHQEVRVNVYEHGVAITPASGLTETRLHKGETLTFTSQRTSKAHKLTQADAPWVSGQLISDNMTLGDLIDEMSRYRVGILRCDPAVAHHRISGVFQLSKTDVALDVIASTLPVRLLRISPYWVSIVEK
ncbi:FecR domain-containing protein [Terasakiella pusilla]|uniref:FecR domain-containing protein n=1 Tax=Terasakiella pusilla TaxID=64973 RepID=UPI003AA8ADC7